MPDDDILEEEATAEPKTVESTSDVEAPATGCVSDSANTAASSDQSCVDSQQRDNT